jgi:multidrug resistance efflux pump
MESLSYQLLAAEQAMADLELQADYDREQAALKIIEAQNTFNSAQEAYDQFDFDQHEEDLDAIKEDVIEAQHDVEDAEDELADYSDLEEDNPTREKYQKAVEDAEDTLNELTRKKSELVNQHDQVVRSLDAAQAGLEIAQEEYEKRTSGPDADQLAILNAQVRSIRAAMDAVTYKLDQLLLTASITGQVMEIKPVVNEAITAGQVVLIMADTKEWYVETDDLNELEIVEVSEAQSVQIEVEAFPDQYYTGTVLEISDMPNFSQGDVLYTVKIRFLEQDLPDLRWGMTVITTFEH